MKKKREGVQTVTEQEMTSVACAQLSHKNTGSDSDGKINASKLKESRDLESE